MNFFSECDQIRRKLQIWSHLLKKSLCAVQQTSVKNKQRICCDGKERDRNLNKLGKGLVQRSYSKHCFNIKFAKPISITRKTLLRNGKKEPKPTKTIPLIAKYNPSDLNSIPIKQRDISKIDKEHRRFFKTLIAYSRNLKDTIRSTVRPETAKKC